MNGDFDYIQTLSGNLGNWAGLDMEFDDGHCTFIFIRYHIVSIGLYAEGFFLIFSDPNFNL